MFQAFSKATASGMLFRKGVDTEPSATQNFGVHNPEPANCSGSTFDLEIYSIFPGLALMFTASSCHYIE